MVLGIPMTGDGGRPLGGDDSLRWADYLERPEAAFVRTHVRIGHGAKDRPAHRGEVGEAAVDRTLTLRTGAGEITDECVVGNGHLHFDRDRLAAHAVVVDPVV